MHVPDWEKALNIYNDSKGKIKLIDIATQLKVPLGTVKSWKHRYNWDGESGHNENKLADKAKKDYIEGMKYKEIARKHEVSINTVKGWVRRYNWSVLERKKAKKPFKLKVNNANKQIKKNSKKPIVSSNQEELVNINNFLYQRLMYEFEDNVDKLSRYVEEVIIASLEDRDITDDDVKKIMGRDKIETISRYEILERAGFKCQACGARPSKMNDVTLHIDHIVPYSLGGTNEMDNLQVLCHRCNASKGNKYAINHNDGWNRNDY